MIFRFRRTGVGGKLGEGIGKEKKQNGGMRKVSWEGKLSETAGLAFGFEQTEDVVDLDCLVGVVSLAFCFCAFFS